MSLWMLLAFAVCMFSAVLSFSPQGIGPWALPLFTMAATAFLAGLARSGIRRPVV